MGALRTRVRRPSPRESRGYPPQPPHGTKKKKRKKKKTGYGSFFFSGLVPCARFRLRGTGGGARGPAATRCSGPCLAPVGTWATAVELVWLQRASGSLPRSLLTAPVLPLSPSCRLPSSVADVKRPPWGLAAGEKAASDGSSWGADSDSSWLFYSLLIAC